MNNATSSSLPNRLNTFQKALPGSFIGISLISLSDLCIIILIDFILNSYLPETLLNPPASIILSGAESGNRK